VRRTHQMQKMMKMMQKTGGKGLGNLFG